MDNSIPPVLNPSVNNPVIDKGVNGTIENAPDVLKYLDSATRPSAMLEVLNNSKTMLMQSLSGSLKLELNNQLLKIPVDIKLSVPLELPPEQINNINVKIMPKQDGNLQVKLIAVNNEAPEKFIAKTDTVKTDNTKMQIKPQFGGKETSALQNAIVNTTGTAVRKVELAPLKIDSLIENIARKNNIPSEQVKPIVEELKNIAANIKLSSIQDGKQIEAVKPQSTNIFENIKQIMQNFATAKTPLNETVSLIKNELGLMKNMMLPAETVAMPDKNLVMFKTPFGDVLADTPLKLENGVKVLLNIEEIIRQIDNKVLPLISEKAEFMPKVTSMNEPVGNLLKILQPLIDSGNHKLAAAVMSKVPAPDSPKMLSNLVSFVKGANHNDLSRWLGAEIMEQLTTSVEGRDVVSRLGSMFVNTNHDNVTWRVIEIPVYNGENISKIRVAVKKIQEEDEEEAKKLKKKTNYGTRFVVDTTFTKLGSFQFDGYALEKEKRFDLIIRTEQNLGDDFCANVMRIFKNTLHELEYAGNVKINVKEKFIKVCDDKPNNEILKSGIYI